MGDGCALPATASLRPSRTLRLFEATPLGSFGGAPRVNPIPEAPQTSHRPVNKSLDRCRVQTLTKPIAHLEC
jgi:hypothetical protein